MQTEPEELQKVLGCLIEEFQPVTLGEQSHLKILAVDCLELVGITDARAMLLDPDANCGADDGQATDDVLKPIPGRATADAIISARTSVRQSASRAALCDGLLSALRGSVPFAPDVVAEVFDDFWDYLWVELHFYFEDQLGGSAESAELDNPYAASTPVEFAGSKLVSAADMIQSLGGIPAMSLAVRDSWRSFAEHVHGEASAELQRAQESLRAGEAAYLQRRTACLLSRLDLIDRLEAHETRVRRKIEQGTRTLLDLQRRRGLPSDSSGKRAAVRVHAQVRPALAAGTAMDGR